MELKNADEQKSSKNNSNINKSDSNSNEREYNSNNKSNILNNSDNKDLNNVSNDKTSHRKIKKDINSNSKRSKNDWESQVLVRKESLGGKFKLFFNKC